MDAGATVDTGPTLAQRQRTALGRWSVEMSQGEEVMRAYVDRNAAMFDAAGVAGFSAAARTYRETAASSVADAGPDPLAYGITRMTTAVAPAYCRVIAAYLAATAMVFPEPRVRCSELPTPPEGWWTRYE